MDTGGIITLQNIESFFYLVLTIMEFVVYLQRRNF